MAKTEPPKTPPAPEAAAEWAPLDSLHSWKANPRKNDETIKKVAELIKRYGWGRPIGARRENGEIIWGHSATGAARLLRQQWKRAKEAERAKWHPDARRTAVDGVVPVRFRDDLTEREAHDLALADNKSQELSEWDDALLAEHLAEASVREADLMCFGADELQKLLFGEREDEDADGAAKLTGLKYSVVVECESEEHQAELLERFEAEGLPCKPLIA